MIIFCHLLNDRSGSPTVLRSTLNALNARKNGLLFVGSQGRGILDDAQVPTQRYWYYRSRRRLITLFTFLISQFMLYRALSKSQDIPRDAIVFVNTLLPFGAMLWGRRNQHRVIVHVHEVSISPKPLRYLLTWCAARCSDQLLYVSHDHYSRLPIKGPPAEVLSNPVDPAFTEAALKTAYAPRSSGRFEVLMLASLRQYKGIEEFINLAQSLRQRQDIHFVLVLNADAKEISDFANRHQNLNNVSLHPRTDTPAEYYATADLVLNLARVDQWIETFGLTIVEAMTFGIPVIAPPLGGPAEIITHEIDGFCIDSRDSETLKTTVLRLADNSALATAISTAAQLRAGDFTFASYERKLRQIMSKLQKTPKSGDVA